MTKKLEMAEGRDAFMRFREATASIVAVPHSEIKRKIEQHRKAAARNPHRRGPKSKVK